MVVFDQKYKTTTFCSINREILTDFQGTIKVRNAENIKNTDLYLLKSNNQQRLETKFNLFRQPEN